jgi:hypothetical protein
LDICLLHRLLRKRVSSYVAAGLSLEQILLVLMPYTDNNRNSYYCVRFFHHCDRIPEQINLREEGFILGLIVSQVLVHRQLSAMQLGL